MRRVRLALPDLGGVRLRLYVTTLNPTDSLMNGFLPAAESLDWDVTLLTDQPDRYAGFDVLHADVRDARAVIETIAAHHPPDVIFSNSDHLQAETALAAAYFGLPGKDWRACVTAKNKALTRRRLAEAGVETVRSVRLHPDDPPPTTLPYPAVLKPREGVASENVLFCPGPERLAIAAKEVWARLPGVALVAEEYLDGPLRTLETLGDGHVRQVLGGFHTTLGPPPCFVEERLDWGPPGGHATHIIAALDALGVGFGACHTEYVVTGAGPRIIEVNYRAIGDNCDFLLADLLGVPLFEWILRVHAGEPAPVPPAPPSGHGAAVSVVADRSGVIEVAAPAIDLRTAGVRLAHRPCRAAGDTVAVTGTNRDYLGVIRAIGPTRPAVDAAIGAFRAEHPWVIS